MDLIENSHGFHGTRMDQSKITMVFGVQEWIYRELPWFSWSQGGSERQLHSLQGPEDRHAATWTRASDQAARPPAHFFI